MLTHEEAGMFSTSKAGDKTEFETMSTAADDIHVPVCQTFIALSFPAPMSYPLKFNPPIPELLKLSWMVIAEL